MTGEMEMKAGMEYFSKRLDEIFEQGMPTKAQILDAYNKAIGARMPTDMEIETWMQDNRWASARQYAKWLCSR
jgi:hypothetical protein